MSVRMLAWRGLYELLAARVRRPEWAFMNYGYVPRPGTPPLTLEPADEPDRLCIQLYDHVLGDTPLRGAAVLEVGCGRGGGASFLARYLGPDGIRSNLVAAGPIDSMAKKAIPGADAFNDVWSERAPLAWDAKDTVPSAKAVVALLSDWFPATTGEMIHVDGGLHSTGA